MKITFSDKCLTQHQKLSKKLGSYFGKEGTPSRIKFKTGNFTLDTFEKIIGNGHTLGYQCNNDDNLNRKNGYIGSQYIIVDIDGTDLTMDEIIDKVENKPTIIHTTFSNKTNEKNNKYCYHLIYCLNEVVYGEDNFYSLFNFFTKGIEDLYDTNAKDCHRITFTSNSTLPNYEYRNLNVVYDGMSIIKDNSYDSFDTFFTSNTECQEISSYNISSSYNDILREEKISQNEKPEVEVSRKPIKNEFSLSEEFFTDLNTLSRQEFIVKYADIYPYITETIVDKSLYVDGYADLTGIDYYKVPSAQYTFNHVTNKREIKKVQIGNRDNMLFVDGITFIKIIPNITKEYLVYLLITTVYKFYSNADKQLTNYYIIQKAKNIWNNADNLYAAHKERMCKLDMNYWREKGIKNPLEAVRIIKKQQKDIKFGSMYDLNESLEGNVRIFKELGYKVKKETVKAWLEENQIEYFTDKDKRNEFIINCYKEDNKRSSRDIEKICKENGVKASRDTINKVVKEYLIMSEK